jgi:hypothetical protein
VSNREFGFGNLETTDAYRYMLQRQEKSDPKPNIQAK